MSFREAVRTTDRLIALFKQRIGATPLVAFTADSDGNFTAQWRLIFQRQGISFVEDVAKRIGEQEARGMALRLADGAHWNAAGHALCGATLAEWLSEHRYVPVSRRREGAGRATQDAG